MVEVNYPDPQKTGKIYRFIDIHHSVRSQPFHASFGDFQDKVATNV